MEPRPVEPSGAAAAGAVPDAHGKNVQVIARIRPGDGDGSRSLFTDVTRTTVTMPTTYAKDLMCYKFNRVFQPGDTDAEVFDSVRPVIEDVLCGVNGAILAYGQQGAGKTRTMVGIPGNDRCVTAIRSTGGPRQLPQPRSYAAHATANAVSYILPSFCMTLLIIFKLVLVACCESISFPLNHPTSSLLLLPARASVPSGLSRSPAL